MENAHRMATAKRGIQLILEKGHRLAQCSLAWR